MGNTTVPSNIRNFWGKEVPGSACATQGTCVCVCKPSGVTLLFGFDFVFASDERINYS